MPYIPRTVSTIQDSVRNKLKNQISKLTNFEPTSFNAVWNEAFSERFRDNELALLAVQLNGWVSYAGGDVTEEDLDALGVSDNVDPDEVNQYMSDDDLDNLVELVGIERSPGERAEGTVTFTTVSSPTTIPEGTLVSTEIDSEGNSFEYELLGPDQNTSDDISTASGDTEVDGFVQAVEPGSDHNTGSGTVTRLPNPPTGVQSVTNDNALTGGTDEESNDDLRDRAKNAIFNTSGGGTAQGVVGYVRSNVEDVQSVAIKEYPGGNSSTGTDYDGPGGPGGASSTSPFADVIVEGGSDSDNEDAIDESRPVAVKHNLVRPTFIATNVSVNVEGDNISTSDIESAVTQYLDRLDLGEDVVRDKIVQRVMNADADVDNISSMTVSINAETITYDSDNSGGDAPNHPQYKLNKGDQMLYDSTDDSNNSSSSGITTVTGTLNGSSHEFVEGTDYDEVNVDGTSNDGIDWGLAGDNPDEDTDFEVTYQITEDIPVDEYEKAESNSVSATVV